MPLKLSDDTGGKLLTLLKTKFKNKQGENAMYNSRLLLDRWMDSFFDMGVLKPLLLTQQEVDRYHRKTILKDLKDGSTEYVFEVPGYEKDKLTVELEDGILKVTGERFDGQKLHFAQFVGGNVITSAKLKNGLLTINVKNQKNTKKIEIEE